MTGSTNTVDYPLGFLDAWCADGPSQIHIQRTYTGTIYSSYEIGILNQNLSLIGNNEGVNDPLVPKDLSHPSNPYTANLSLVNWVLGNTLVSSATYSDTIASTNTGVLTPYAGIHYYTFAADTTGTLFTYGDIQQAIWRMLGGATEINPYNGLSTKTHVDALITLAVNNGTGYVPDAGQKLAVILDLGTDASGKIQPLIIETQAAKIGDYVWEDKNGNGIQDDGDRTSDIGLGGVSVTLSGINDLGAIIVPVTIQTNPDGSYSVAETTPAGYLDGKDTAGTGSTSVCGNDLINVTLAAGQTSADNNFGELLPASIKGNVYYDANNDGSRTGETGLGSVSITLTGTDDLNQAVSITKATNPDGSYSFDGLRPGTYQVAEEQPMDYLDGKDTIGSKGGIVANDQFSAIVLNAGDNSINNNFGEVKPASLSGYVYVDVGNDGVKGATEAGIGNVTVKLSGTDDLGHAVTVATTTNSSGYYEFTNLRPGTYGVAEIQPANYLDGKDTIGSKGGSVANDLFSNVVLASGDNSVNNNFGELPQTIAGVDIEKLVRGSYVEHTPGGGTEGFTPGYWKTHSSYGTASGDTLDWELTGYEADDKVNAVFGLNIAVDPTFYQALSSGGGGVNALLRQAVSGLLSAAHPSIDYKYSTEQVISMTKQAFSSGDYVTNKDLFQTENSKELSGAFDTPSSKGVHTVVTADYDADTAPGLSLAVGGTAIYTYIVKNTGNVELGNIVVTDDKITTLTFTGGDTDGDHRLDTSETWVYTASEYVQAGLRTNVSTVVATNAITGATVTDTDAANYTGNSAGATAIISGFVYNDANNDGIKQSTEAAIANATVTLTGTNDLGQPVNVTGTTDANGFYQFTGLRAGTYAVTETQPTGYADGKDTIGTAGGNDTVNDKFSNIVLTNGASSTNNNFGELKVVATASLGDRVWLDTNANGVQDTTETAGVAGVKVTLTGGGLDGKLSTTGDNTTATTTTDATGKYGFSGLTAGEYQVKFDVSTATGPAYFLTKQDVGNNVGTSDAVDSDANRTTGLSQVVTLAAGQSNTTVDAGVYQKASLGDKVWDDMNHNYVQDASEPGIGGIRVTLWTAGANGVYDNGTGDDIKVANTTTNSTGSIGNYLFSNLDPGDYYLMFDKANVQHYNATYGASYNMSNWKWAVKDTGTNDAKDSDVTGNAVATTDVTSTSKINLVSGENDMTWDAGITPIAIDLNGDGIHSVSRQDSKGTFDLFGNGKAISSGWLSSDDGFLAVDKNGNGKVDGISELFGGNAKGAGFAQLASYDSNGDGVVNAADEHFGDLRIWQDKNGDHQTDGNELMTLAQAGVSLKVSFTELPFLDGNGNLHLERSSATLSNGNAADVTDLYLNVATADATAAGVETQSLSGIANGDTGTTTQNSSSIVNEQLLNSWLNGDQSHANGDLGVTLDAHSFLIDTASTDAAPSASVAVAPVGAEAVGHASQSADAFAPVFQAPACRLSGSWSFHIRIPKLGHGNGQTLQMIAA
ncbi:MAG: SdrD B-like domain-containing protein [Candidatus Methylumidiphilus sp.]